MSEQWSEDIVMEGSGVRAGPAMLSYDASSNVTGLVGLGNEVMMEFVDVGGDAVGTTVEV